MENEARLKYTMMSLVLEVQLANSRWRGEFVFSHPLQKAH
jgi:hypothetical protein